MKAGGARWWRWCGLGLALVVVGSIALLLVAKRQFSQASEQFRLRHPLGHYFLVSLQEGGDTEGSLTVPVSVEGWGEVPVGRDFLEAINKLDEGPYRYRVWFEDGHWLFEMTDAEGALVSSGYVPDENLPALQPRDLVKKGRGDARATE